MYHGTFLFVPKHNECNWEKCIKIKIAIIFIGNIFKIFQAQFGNAYSEMLTCCQINHCLHNLSLIILHVEFCNMIFSGVYIWQRIQKQPPQF